MWLISETKNAANDVVPMIRICSSVYLWMTLSCDDKSQVSYKMYFRLDGCVIDSLSFYVTVSLSHCLFVSLSLSM